MGIIIATEEDGRRGNGALCLRKMNNVIAGKRHPTPHAHAVSPSTLITKPDVIPHHDVQSQYSLGKTMHEEGSTPHPARFQMGMDAHMGPKRSCTRRPVTI